MIEILPFIAAFITGILLGGIFFGGLWWTIQKGLSATNPALWFISSLILRVAITVSGFYFIAAGNWQKLVVCLVGFIITRFLISHFLRLPVSNSIPKI